MPGVAGFDPFGDVQAIENHGNSFLTSSERQKAMRKDGANRGWGATTRQAWPFAPRPARQKAPWSAYPEV
jgi:hypothetical protein